MQPQVENTGNVDLSEVGVVHPRIASDCPTAVTTLGPGDNFQCEGTYALSWVDIASGVLDIPAKWGSSRALLQKGYCYTFEQNHFSLTVIRLFNHCNLSTIHCNWGASIQPLYVRTRCVFYPIFRSIPAARGIESYCCVSSQAYNFNKTKQNKKSIVGWVISLWPEI